LMPGRISPIGKALFSTSWANVGISCTACIELAGRSSTPGLYQSFAPTPVFNSREDLGLYRNAGS
jgi:hypothetical protein